MKDSAVVVGYSLSAKSTTCAKKAQKDADELGILQKKSEVEREQTTAYVGIQLQSKTLRLVVDVLLMEVSDFKSRAQNLYMEIKMVENGQGPRVPMR